MVTIPRLKQITPSSALPSNDRLKGQVRDQSANILSRTSQVVNLGERAIKINKVYEDDKIDSLSSEANQKYDLWNAEQLQKLKVNKGDPTDAYAQYDLDEKEFFDKLIADKPDLNERVKRGYTSSLVKAQNSNKIKVLKQRGLQTEVYKQGLFNSDLQLNKNKLAISAGNITKGDKSLSFEFINGLNDIKTIVAKNGLRIGTTELYEGEDRGDHSFTNADGEEVKVKYKPADKAALYKHMNAGVTSSVDVLIASGKTAEARDMMDDYSIYIDSKSKTRFEKKLKVTEVDNEAMSIFDTIRGKSSDAQTKTINNIKDGDVRTEVEGIRATSILKLNTVRKAKEEKNYNRLANTVIDKMNSSNPYHGISDLKRDPTFKATWENLNPSDKKHILALVKPVKDSSKASIIDVQKLVLDNTEIRTMTPELWGRKISKLSKADQTHYNGIFQRLRTESGSEESSRLGRVRRMLFDQMVSKKLIRLEYGKNTIPRYMRKEIDANDKLVELMNDQTKIGPMSSNEERDFVKDYVSSLKSGEAFVPPVREVFDVERTGKEKLPPTTPEERKAFFKEYRKINKRSPTVNELEAFIENQRGR